MYAAKKGSKERGMYARVTELSLFFLEPFKEGRREERRERERGRFHLSLSLSSLSLFLPPSLPLKKQV